MYNSFNSFTFLGTGRHVFQTRSFRGCLAAEVTHPRLSLEIKKVAFDMMFV